MEMAFRQFIVFVIVISVALASSVYADQWPEIVRPEKTKLVIVADEMVVNGVATKSWELKSWLPNEEVFEFYRNEWNKRHSDKNRPPYIEYDLNGWESLSRMEGDFQIVVQLAKTKKRSRGAKGLVSIARISDLGKRFILGKNFPRLGKMKIINDISSIDQNKKSRTIVAITDASVGHAAKFYKSSFTRKGWLEKGGASSALDQIDRSMFFSRRGRELILTVTKNDSKTGVIAVFVDY